jgi:hypothetical protein
MKKSYLNVALTLTVLLGAGINALAQDPDRVVAKVPFEFVVGTKTLPAGTYSIAHFSPANSGLLIQSDRNGEFVLPIDADDAPGGSAKLIFEQVGGKHFLSKVATPEHIYNLATSPEMIKLGAVRDNDNASSAGGN